VTPGKERDIVCGTVAENFVLIPRSEALRLVSIHKAINHSKTWGDFKRQLRPEDWQEVLKGFPTLADYRDEESFASDEEALESYHSLRFGERMPIDSDKFKPDWVPGFSDGDWPQWPAQQALNWVPAKIQRQFGKTNSSALNGSFLKLDPQRAAEIIAAMEEIGYVCERNDALVQSASGH